MNSSEASISSVPETPSSINKMNEIDDAKARALEEERRKKLKPGSPGKYRQIQMPTPEVIVQEDFMNNCAVRTVLSGVMGSALGVLFGVFMGTMDSAVRCSVIIE